MGWTFVRQTRDQLIRELIAPQASERACCEVIDHTLDGDGLWTVVRVRLLHRLPSAGKLWRRLGLQVPR